MISTTLIQSNANNLWLEFYADRLHNELFQRPDITPFVLDHSCSLRRIEFTITARINDVDSIAYSSRTFLFILAQCEKLVRDHLNALYDDALLTSRPAKLGVMIGGLEIVPLKRLKRRQPKCVLKCYVDIVHRMSYN